MIFIQCERERYALFFFIFPGAMSAGNPVTYQKESEALEKRPQKLLKAIIIGKLVRCTARY